MPSGADIKNAMAGAWRLFCGDRQGLERFDLSAEGFFRSFWVIVLVAPIYAASVLTERSLLLSGRFPADDFSDGLFFAARALTFVIDWFTFPLVMIFVTRRLHLGERYAAYITVRNWTALPSAALTSLPTIAYGLDLVPILATTLATYVFLIIVLRFGWFIARSVLQTSAAIAAAIVALDLSLSLLIGRIGDVLAGL